MEHRLKSVSDLAKILGCNKTTIYRLLRKGKIPHRRVGSLYRFCDSDVDTYLESVKEEGNNEK